MSNQIAINASHSNRSLDDITPQSKRRVSETSDVSPQTIPPSAVAMLSPSSLSPSLRGDIDNHTATPHLQHAQHSDNRTENENIACSSFSENRLDAHVDNGIERRNNPHARMVSGKSPYDHKDREILKNAFHSLLELKNFLETAPSNFSEGDIICQFRLPNDEQISCVHWADAFYITGTDIVRSMIRRFTIFGREIINRKKFEEGVFSDLRNLKVNVDSTLEGSKSKSLEILYKRHCVRTKKKQKVFFWTAVNHERLFIDALSRELRKEANTKQFSNPQFDLHHEAGTAQAPASTVAVREPASSFKCNTLIPLVDQIPEILAAMDPLCAKIFRELTTGTFNMNEEVQRHIRVPIKANHASTDQSKLNRPAGKKQVGSYFQDDHCSQNDTGSVSCSPRLESTVSPKTKNYPITPQMQSQKLLHEKEGSIAHGAQLSSPYSNPNLTPQAYTNHPSDHQHTKQTLRERLNNTGKFRPSVQRYFYSNQKQAHDSLQDDTCTNNTTTEHPSLLSTNHSCAISTASESNSLIMDKRRHSIKDELLNREEKFSEKIAATSVPMDTRLNEIDTDFPSDLLVKEDHEVTSSMPLFSARSFNYQYSDFVHQHRPALSFPFQSEFQEYYLDQAQTAGFFQPLIIDELLDNAQNIQNRQSNMTRFSDSPNKFSDWNERTAQHKLHGPVTPKDFRSGKFISEWNHSDSLLFKAPSLQPTPAPSSIVYSHKQPINRVTGCHNGVHKLQQSRTQPKQPAKCFKAPPNGLVNTNGLEQSPVATGELEYTYDKN